MSIDSIGNKCCGCRACLQNCELKAISFVTDTYGFEYPKIDSKHCANCGLCEKVCPIINDTSSSDADLCGMAYALDEKVKYNGSSGGLFGVLRKA